MVQVIVELLAFGGGGLRTVNVPVVEWDATPNLLARLDLVFRYGQNDFQPQPRPSVSVGDVIRLNGRWRVSAFGFTKEA